MGKPFGVNLGVLVKANTKLVALAFDADGAHTLAKQSQGGVVDEAANGTGEGAIPVFEFGTDFVELRFAQYSGNALVHAQPLVLLGNIVVGDANVEGEIELDFRFFRSSLATQFADGALEHRGVKLEADGFDLATLFASQQIPRATQFQIQRCQLKASTKIREFFQSSQAAAGQRREFCILRDHQVGVGAAIGAANAASKLVQLREAEAVGSIDEDGVAERNIEAVFDDRRCDENVRLVMHEFQHHFFQLALRHLPVANENTRLGN